VAVVAVVVVVAGVAEVAGVMLTRLRSRGIRSCAPC
jgi:hypothetical protein